MRLAERQRILEEIASDTAQTASTRCRALEELGRIEARQHLVAAVDPDELPEDPMADLDELEEARQARARKRAAR